MQKLDIVYVSILELRNTFGVKWKLLIHEIQVKADNPLNAANPFNKIKFIDITNW